MRHRGVQVRKSEDVARQSDDKQCQIARTHASLSIRSRVQHRRLQEVARVLPLVKRMTMRQEHTDRLVRIERAKVQITGRIPVEVAVLLEHT